MTLFDNLRLDRDRAVLVAEETRLLQKLDEVRFAIQEIDDLQRTEPATVQTIPEPAADAVRTVLRGEGE